MFFSDDFLESIIDYKYLIEKKYSPKSMLKIIGDRYKLSGVERTILYRGISTIKQSEYRKNKLIDEEKLTENVLFIDGYNVLITIGCYLKGGFTFFGTDGFLRDTEESHGNIRKTEIVEKSLSLTLEYLKLKKTKQIRFFFDAPISNSKIFSDFVSGQINQYKLCGYSEISDSPDFVLKNLEEGICSTSDSLIIDNCKIQIIDLAFNVLKYFYNPTFFAL
jgi:hypothetical protein